LFLTAIILCTNCQKRETAIVQENTENSSPTTVEASADDGDLISLPLSGIMTQSARDTIIRPIQMEGKTIQETIENYTFPRALPIDQGIYAFQIEGNFTGSGNREIIAFYKYENRDSINTAFCFVCDSGGEKIENVHYIKYGTIDFDEKDEAETGLVEIINLGRAITYKDRIIGRVSDFNGNGREELYLYSVSGRNIEPYFFEFNGTEFEGIIKLGSPDRALVIGIDPIEQVITLSIRNYRYGQDINLIEEINSYRWDDTVHQYEELTSESKYYRWNRILKEYEEIE